MKIVWLSPYGNGWSIAHRIREAGNKVILWTPTQNGSGYLPTIPWSQAETMVNKADLVVCDNNFPSRPTRRSWEASDQVMMLNAIVKKRGVPYVGPLPTTELIENDPRYMKKVAKRCGLPLSGEVGAEPAILLSLDPSGKLFLVLRERSETLNLCDVCIPCPTVPKLANELFDKLVGFTRSIGYNGYLNIELTVGPEGPNATRLGTGFLYPAIFAQWSLPPASSIGLTASTILNEHSTTRDAAALHHLLKNPVFFGCELHTEGESPSIHGEILGATVKENIDSDIPLAAPILDRLRRAGLL